MLKMEISTNIILMNFWEIVDEELEYKNIDRKELASKVGFNVSNISKGIRENNIPSADTAVQIAKILGVSVEYLVTGQNSKNLESEDTYETALFKKYRLLIKKIEQLPESTKEGLKFLIDKLSEK